MNFVNYGYIYETINNENGRLYIGKSKGIFNSNYHGSGIVLKRAIDKYGKDSFHTKLINYAETRRQLNEMEKAHISAYREVYGTERLYNISSGGDGGPITKGYKHSIAIRKKMSLAQLKSYSLGRTSGFKDKQHTKEAKEQDRLKHLGNHHTAEAIENMRQAQKGKKVKPFTKKHIENLSKSHIGNPNYRANSYYKKGNLYAFKKGNIPWNKGISYSHNQNKLRGENDGYTINNTAV